MSIVNVKKISLCGSYPDDRTGIPSAVAFARQKNKLNSHGQAEWVIGPVGGAFGEMPSDFLVIAYAVAEELAVSTETSR